MLIKHLHVSRFRGIQELDWSLDGALIFLIQENIRPRLARRTLQVGLALLILVMGASRVYLGVHWPSDVIGGYLLGGLALGGLIWLRNRLVIRGR